MNKEWEKWTDKETKEFQDQFIQWYEQEKRNLPWRYNRDPYRIWISEIMLQQTRVDTVIDYFYRFMEWFPTIEELAKAFKSMGGPWLLLKSPEHPSCC